MYESTDAIARTRAQVPPRPNRDMSQITDKVEWWRQVVAVREHDQRYYPSENHATDLLQARLALRRAERKEQMERWRVRDPLRWEFEKIRREYSADLDERWAFNESIGLEGCAAPLDRERSEWLAAEYRRLLLALNGRVKSQVGKRGYVQLLPGKQPRYTLIDGEWFPVVRYAYRKKKRMKP